MKKQAMFGTCSQHFSQSFPFLLSEGFKQVLHLTIYGDKVQILHFTHVITT